MTHKISNKQIVIKVKEHGAELCSLKKINDNYEYMWQANEKYWNRHSPILFPIVGKLLNDTYTYANIEYKLTQHGFARDKKFEVFSKSENSICFKLCDDENTLKIYPFKFELYVTYLLKDNNLEISYKIKNKTDGKMYFSIGSHPAFNWEKSIEDKKFWYFQFQEQKILNSYVIKKDGISKNKINIDLDSNKLLLNEEIFSNDALIIDDLKINSVSLKNTKNKKEIKVDFDKCEYLGLWSKPTGAPFICIEPWNGIADFINHNKKLEEKIGINKLEKDEVYNTKYCIEI